MALYRVWENMSKVLVEEVEVAKETGKQYKIVGHGRSTVNKSELDTFISYHGVFSENRDNAIRIWNEHYKDIIENTERNMKHYRGLLINEESPSITPRKPINRRFWVDNQWTTVPPTQEELSEMDNVNILRVNECDGTQMLVTMDLRGAVQQISGCTEEEAIQKIKEGFIKLDFGMVSPCGEYTNCQGCEDYPCDTHFGPQVD